MAPPSVLDPSALHAINTKAPSKDSTEDSGYAGSSRTASNATNAASSSTASSSRPEIVPVPNHGQIDGVSSDRNLAVNRHTGDLLDDDTGEIVITTTTTTTTTTRRRGNGNLRHANSYQSPIHTPTDQSNYGRPLAEAQGDPHRAAPQHPQPLYPQAGYLMPQQASAGPERPSLSQHNSDQTNIPTSDLPGQPHGSPYQQEQTSNSRPEPSKSSSHVPQARDPGQTRPQAEAEASDSQRGRKDTIERWEALEELKKASREAAPAWKSTLKNLEGVAVGLHAMGKTLEPKLEEMDRRQMEKMEKLQAQQKAQRAAHSNGRTQHTNGNTTAANTQSQMSKEEAKRAKSKDRVWNMNDTVPVAERRRFRSASPEHPGLSPRVRAIPPPNGTIRAEEWAPAHAPPDPMYQSSGLDNTTTATSKADDSTTSKADSSSKHSSEEKQEQRGFMTKLKKKMGAS